MIGGLLLSGDVEILMSGGGALLLLLVAFFVLSLYSIYLGFNLWKRSNMIRNTPTEKVQSMAVGRTELEGTIREYNGTFRPPFVDDDCVYVYWEAERKDGGKNGNKWRTLTKGTERVPFILEDETGEVLVRADDDEAEFEIDCDTKEHSLRFGRRDEIPDEIVDFIERTADVSVSHEKADSILGSIKNRLTEGRTFTRKGDRRRYKQEILRVNTEGYVFGSAEPRDNESDMREGQEDLLEIRRHDGSDVFLVSNLSEDELKRKYNRWGPLYMLGGFFGSIIALFFLLMLLAVA